MTLSSLRLYFVSICFIVAVSALCLAWTAAGQTTSATVSGRITDASGAVVPDADVQLQSAERGTIMTAKTNSAGIYLFANVEPGQYQITVRKAGFKQTDLVGLIVNVQDHIEQNFRLEVGSTSESVTVEGAAPLLNTQDATVGTVIDRQFVANTPLNGRTLQSLITLTPGIQVVSPGFGDQGQFTANGQRTDANYFTVDGVSANTGIDSNLAVRQTGGSVPGLSALGTTNTLVSLDDIQEFRIQTSTFAPEFGRTPGAQVSIVTRSGTNAFHGTVFEYLRNDHLDANNWFGDQQGLPKPEERQNDFGGVFGGPIFKDRTFFFFSYEGLRLRQPETLITVVPDIPSRTSVPAALQPFLNAFPVPTGAASPLQAAESVAPDVSNPSNPSSLNSTSLRIDHTLTKSLNLFARYNYAPSSVTTFGGAGAPQNQKSSSRVRAQTLTAGATKTLGASAADEFIFNYSRMNTALLTSLTSAGGAIVPAPSQLIPPSEGVNVAPADTALEFLEIVSGVNFTTGPVAQNVQRQINLVDNFSLIEGTHKLKFGLDYRRINPLTRGTPYVQIPVFCGITTNFCGSSGSVMSGVTLEELTASTTSVSLVFPNYSLYAQDTWNLNPRLTLTYGLRWEINPAPTAQDGQHLVSFVNPFDVSNLTLAPIGTPFYKTTWDNLAPRVGVAYQLRQSRGMETVVRGGFGTFYDLGSNQAGFAATTFPFFREGVTPGAAFPFSPAVAAPIPFTLNPGPPFFFGAVAAADPNLVLPRTYEWNFAVQQSLGASQTITATYLGSAGRDLMRNVILNSSLVPNSDTVLTNGATSHYNALQLQFQRRLSRGLQALASYTWSHSIDDQSFNTGANSQDPSTFNPALERGSSDFDVRHSFSGAVTYDVPNEDSLGWAGKIFLNDWAIDAIVSAHTATPIDISVGTSLPGAGGSSSITRPNIVSGQPFYLSGAACEATGNSTVNGVPTPCPGGKGLNPAAFAAPPSGQQGNLGRNVLRGFGAWQLDMALRRQFNLTEKLNLQFRAEFFNIFNHPNFGSFEANMTNPFFGVSTSTLAQSLSASGGLSQLYQFGGPRSIEFGLRLNF